MGEARATANSGTIGLPIDDLGRRTSSQLGAARLSAFNRAPGSGAPSRGPCPVGSIERRAEQTVAGHRVGPELTTLR